MDLPRLKAMEEYNKINPPVHISVARYLGIGEVKPKAPSNQDIEELMASFPQVQR